MEMQGIISKLGDPKKNSDRLKFSLLKIRFPQPYDEAEQVLVLKDHRALTGFPTIFMKIINYALFVSSVSVKNYLLEKNVDPDTVYLNDLKFMKKVFHILVTIIIFKTYQVSIFGYKPCITVDQFFKYGYAEQKMILCCDIINIVRKAARDLKLKKSLSRKRSETARTTQTGRFTVLNHSRDEKKDFVYERDSVNKIAKVSKLDDKLQQSREASRIEHRDSINQPRFGSSSALRNRSRSQSLNRYSLTQSRYKLSQDEKPQNCHHGGHTHEEQSQSQAPAFQPLRSKKANDEHLPEQVKQPVQSLPNQQSQQFQTLIQNPQTSQPDILQQLLLSVNQLNSRFEHFERSVDHKIDAIHHDYEDLQSKFHTLSVRQHPFSAEKTTELKERGQLASPYHFSEAAVNPLKEFTFKENDYQRLYSTDGFMTRATREDLQDESRQLIGNIKRNLDESREMLSKYQRE